MAALIWLIGGIVLVAAEILSGDFFLLMLGIGALTAALAEVLFGNTLISLGVFAVSSIGLVTFARPWFKARFHGAIVPDNVQALIGGKATALSRVDDSGGQVKLNGEVWSARSFDDKQVIEPGTSVTVMEITGATAIVWAEPV
ncbi:NfeD family protein [Actinophytocola sp.]|uniref:NfeD family protein n=1 Tax=Actinophytocola sp. TaxID=1872138 RepID=UPI002D7EEBE4|nr:NfeD family protein [Actinophytocola sp.]HET9141647.1 NfeD family protein [Actinophytocola sp.]